MEDRRQDLWSKEISSSHSAKLKLAPNSRLRTMRRVLALLRLSREGCHMLRCVGKKMCEELPPEIAESISDMMASLSEVSVGSYLG